MHACHIYTQKMTNTHSLTHTHTMYTHRKNTLILTARQTNTHINIHKETDRQTDRETGRQVDRQIDRHIHTHIFSSNICLYPLHYKEATLIKAVKGQSSFISAVIWIQP